MYAEAQTTRPQRRSTFFYRTYINSVHTSQETHYISVMYPETLTSRPQRRSPSSSSIHIYTQTATDRPALEGLLHIRTWSRISHDKWKPGSDRQKSCEMLDATCHKQPPIAVILTTTEHLLTCTIVRCYLHNDSAAIDLIQQLRHSMTALNANIARRWSTGQRLLAATCPPCVTVIH
jgi:hypothetical protein